MTLLLQTGYDSGPKRTFLLYDDNHPNYFTGRIVRTQQEVTAAVWRLKVGDVLRLTDTTGIMRGND